MTRHPQGWRTHRAGTPAPLYAARRTSASRGFTLVEIMTVSVILTLILGGVLSSFTLGQRSMAIVDDRTQLYQTARLVQAQLQRDLGSLWAPAPDPEAAQETSPTDTSAGAGPGAIPGLTAGTEEQLTPPVKGEAPNPGSGRSSEIEVLIAIPPELTQETSPRVDVLQVVYYCDTDPETPEQGLIRGVNRYVDVGDPEETTTFDAFAPDVVDFEVQYYDSDQQEWAQEWTSQTPPKALLYSITVQTEGRKEESVTLTGTIVVPRVLAQQVCKRFTSSSTTTGGESAPPSGPGTGAGMPSPEDLMGMAGSGDGP